MEFLTAGVVVTIQSFSDYRLATTFEVGGCVFVSISNGT